MSKKILIKGATVFNSDHCFYGDILIVGETIAQLGTDLSQDVDLIVNAKGRYTFPGGIDAHVHMDVSCEGSSLSAGYDTETVAAAMGGTTTIIDYVMQERSVSLMETINGWRQKAKSQSAIDFGFHVIITNPCKQSLDEICLLIDDEGITSFKLFMANDIALDDGNLLKLLNLFASKNALACIHAENKAMIEMLQTKHEQNGQLSPKFHVKSRPIITESEAVNRVIAFAELTSCKLLIAHVSCGQALDLINSAKERGINIFAESCTHYFVLNDDKYLLPGFESAKYIISPPLREKENSKQLWQGILNGNIDIISSDHNGFSFGEHKKLGLVDYRKIPNGSPGIEHRFTVMLDGCIKNGVPLTKFTELTSSNSARIFGFSHRKGAILPGYDADIVIADPNAPQTITAAKQFQKSDYTPYEGFKLCCSIEAVFLRGKKIVEGNKFVGQAGDGQFIKRA